MQASIALLCTTAVGAIAGLPGIAHSAPSPVEVSDFQEELIVLEAPQGQFLVTSFNDPTERTFWGTQKTVHALFARGSTNERDGEGRLTEVSTSFKDYKVGSESHIKLAWSDGEWTLSCGETPIHVKPLDDTQRERFLSSVQFLTEYWEREALMLARDQYGIYYYIDYSPRDQSSESYHVYTGWMGHMVKSPLGLVARDYEGKVFSTRSGDRRLILDSDATHWIEDDKPKTLKVLSIHANHDFIYGQLGVYADQDFGSPCDRL